jgi:hypothetical protein
MGLTSAPATSGPAGRGPLLFRFCQELPLTRLAEVKMKHSFLLVEEGDQRGEER